MNASNPTYQPLPGRGRSWLASHRLYAGPDHLLQVNSSGYSESYKRFYFRDVQAVVLQRNKMQQAWNWIWGVALGVCLLVWGIGLAGSSFDSGWMIFGSIPALLCLLPLTANLVLGPTCSCHLRTAVHFEKLGALRRVRTAEQTIQRIKSLVEAAQGPFPSESLAPENLSVPDAPPVIEAPPILGTPAVVTPKAPPRHYEAGMHLVLCWLLLADLPSTVLDYFAPSAGQVVGLILFAGTVLLSLMAVAKQHQTDLPAILKRLPWIVLGMFGVIVAVAIGYAIWLGIQGRIGVGLELSVWTDPVLLPLTVASTILSTLLGALGLIEVRRWRAATPVTPPPLVPSEPPPVQP